MAKEFYGYFDSLVEDEREYDAAQFAHILRAGIGRDGGRRYEAGRRQRRRCLWQ